ncbi:MAG: response regulator [Deferribacteraceae bacterium]|jgi:putative two-component system response regulator|nr:response regulator [Deferribacteraceae bacterium]
MNKRKRIIIVDDNISNLTIAKNILKPYYEVFTVPCAEKLFLCLENFIPDLLLLDIEMPKTNGFEVMEYLKTKSAYADIPVVFLTAKHDEKSELKGLELGAVDYICKPFSAPLLLKRLETHILLALRKRELKSRNNTLQSAVSLKNQQVFALENTVLSTIAELVEFRDCITGGHVYRTQKYLQILIERLMDENIYAEKVCEWNPDFLVPSAQLHDVGKIAISDSILNKPGRLTEEEFRRMQDHVIIGVKILERIEKTAPESEYLRYAKSIAATHHEKWDGTGYPHKLKGSAIPLEGRLMAIADVYDALISARPYKKPFTAAEAERIIEEGRGSHFDPVLVDVFHKAAGQFNDIVEECQAETRWEDECSCLEGVV